MFRFLVLRAPRAALLGCAFAAHAQTPPSPQPADTGPIVVTAARLEQPLADALPHTTVLTRDDIERSQALDLEALLSREAGVQFARNGGPGTATSIFLRGAATSQVLVLVDGVPLTRQDASGSVGIEQLMLDAVERIEIVRGNVSAIYGSGAIGGVVQVFTRQGGAQAAPARIAGSLEAGSRGTVRGGVSVSGRSGDTGYSIGLAGYDTRGFSTINPAQEPAANPDRDGFRNGSLTFSLSQGWAAGHRVGVQGWTSDGRTDYDSAFATPADTQKSRTRLGTFSVYSDDEFTADWHSHLTLSLLRDRQNNTETGDFGFDSQYTTRTQSLQWLNTLALGSDWRATGGLEHQRQRIAADDGFGDTYGHARDADAVYAGLAGTAAGQQWQLNVRHDRIEGTGNKTTGYLGWGLALGGGVGARASLSTAFNAPPLGYLYAPFFGNPDLQPERAHSAELGLQYAAGAQLWRATAFASRVRDELAYDFDTSRFENIASTRNRGVELSGSGRLGIDTDWRASLTAQSPRDADTGERLLRRSRTLASATLSHAFGAWRVGVDARYAGARDDTGDRRLGAYGVFDATVQRTLSPGWTAFGRIENLGNEPYQTAYGYNSPARGFFAGLRYNGSP